MDSDARLRGAVRAVLGGGVALSAALMALGLCASWLGLEWSGVLLNAGIAVLIATPAARVALLACGYALGRDWKFFWVCAAVLALLGATLLLRI